MEIAFQGPGMKFSPEEKKKCMEAQHGLLQDVQQMARLVVESTALLCASSQGSYNLLPISLKKEQVSPVATLVIFLLLSARNRASAVLRKWCSAGSNIFKL